MTDKPMTVGELQERLSFYPSQMPVFISFVNKNGCTAFPLKKNDYTLAGNASFNRLEIHIREKD